MNDTERIDWLEEIVNQGACPALVNDDAGRWALVFDGMQNVPDPDVASDISTSFFIRADQWRNTLREALDAGRTEYESDHA